MKTLILRGHHILCSRLFSGHGYNDRFAVRMGEVVARTGLKNYKPPVPYELTEHVKIICSNDYVCSKCPNLIENQTESRCDLGDDDVKEKDRKTLKYAELKENNTYTLEEIAEGVEKITEEQFNEICGTCRWFKAGLCSYEKLKNGGK